jgi:broad specificity phosphatase PhoE
MDLEKAAALVMSQPDPQKFIEDEFEIAINKWMAEEGESLYSEPFAHFKARTIDSIQTIISTARKEKQKEVAAITSGGFISFAIVHFMGIPYERMASLNLNIANASVTCLLFNDEKITLSYYNNYSHLPRQMVTFR